MPGAGAGRRSLADSQNYGTDPTARDLVNPPAFSELNLPKDAMSTPKSFEYLSRFFSDCGYDIEQRIYEAIYDEVSAGARDGVTIEMFRKGLNGYLDAVEDNNEYEWRRIRGL